ncbi:sodium:phosphate symporter [Halovenus amylolytica]|uniref:sodium:phosphate symporter n=1 Tax=Halovenus amylolytica TaxID=2500550 RepID=UPI003D6A43EA
MTRSDELSEGQTGAARVLTLLVEVGPLWIAALATVLLFLFAVQLLGTAIEAAEPFIERILRRVVVGNGSALGLSWLTTYALTNGSVVAALTVTLLRSGLVTVPESFLMIAGSRLGGGAIVVFIGVLDYLQERRGRTLTEGTSLGLLTFLLTFSIYLPVTAFGLVVLVMFQSELLAATSGLDLSLQTLQYFEPVTVFVTRTVGPGLAMVIALALLFGSLWLFDELLEHVDTETVRTYMFQHFERRWVAFAIGLLITGLTTSVAFSLGIVVPLYNREFVRREEIVPYILGANVGTLFDTLVVAFVLETTAGVAIVLLVMGLATLFTLVALVTYEPYTAVIDAWQDRLLEDPRFFLAFGLFLVLLPLTLLLVGHL